MSDERRSPRPLKFVAVLLGVSHVNGKKKTLEFAKKICEEIMLQTEKNQDLQACEKCEVRPRRNITAETAVIQLVKRMEDNPDLNCGLSANFNMNFRVECDAGLMFGKTKTWTGIGAVPECKNPILLAKSLHDHQGKPGLLGLGQPDLLVGTGAKEWIQEHCPGLFVETPQRLTKGASSRFRKHQSTYAIRAISEKAGGGPRKKQRLMNENNLDTFGAIAVDCDYKFAAAVSSGGTLLKHRGGIGHAAVPGGGCWADDDVAVVTTGAGENLSRRLMAKSVAQSIHEARSTFEEGRWQILDEDLDGLEDEFNECIDIPDNEECKNPLGLLAVNAYCGRGYFQPDKKPKLYFHYGYNTNGICIGYMTSGESTGQSKICKQGLEEAGEPFVKTMVFSYD